MDSIREVEIQTNTGTVLVEPAQLRKPNRPKNQLLDEYKDNDEQVRQNLDFEVAVDTRDLIRELRVQTARIARVLEKIADDSFTP